MVEKSEPGLDELLKRLEAAQNRIFAFDSFDHCLTFTMALDSQLEEEVRLNANLRTAKLANQLGSVCLQSQNYKKALELFSKSH